MAADQAGTHVADQVGAAEGYSTVPGGVDNYAGGVTALLPVPTRQRTRMAVRLNDNRPFRVSPSAPTLPFMLMAASGFSAVAIRGSQVAALPAGLDIHIGPQRQKEHQAGLPIGIGSARPNSDPAMELQLGEGFGCAQHRTDEFRISNTPSIPDATTRASASSGVRRCGTGRHPALNQKLDRRDAEIGGAKKGNDNAAQLTELRATTHTAKQQVRSV